MEKVSHVCKDEVMFMAWKKYAKKILDKVMFIAMENGVSFCVATEKLRISYTNGYCYGKIMSCALAVKSKNALHLLLLAYYATLVACKS